MEVNMVEIQKGLLLETKAQVINGKTFIFKRLHSKDGYCFYSKLEKQELDNWDKEEEKPNLKYMRFASLGIHDDPINYVSLPIEKDFEIV
jgi:hypothetical protein